MRKYTFFISLFLIIALCVPNAVEAVSFVPPVDIHSQAVYVVNLDTNEVIYKKNEDQLMPPASLTKIMTAIIVLEQFKDNPEELKTTYISAPSTAFDELYLTGASTADFRINEEVSYSDLLYGLMVRSACEAGTIIAYNIGDGDMSVFVDKMNEKAKEIGANNTHFDNPHGLDNHAMGIDEPETQMTTAHDMALITQYAMTFPNFMDFCTPEFYELEATNKHSQPRTIKNRNKLLVKDSGYYYEYAKGVKTGTLDAAGLCLVSTACKDGYNYLIVTLGAPQYDENGNSSGYSYEDHRNLYEWAYNKLSYEEILNNSEEVGRVEVEYGDKANHVLVKPDEGFSCLWSSDIETGMVKRVILKEESVIAPVNVGDELGSMELQLNGETITTVKLVATSSVERDNFKYKLSVAKQFWSSNMFKKAIYISLIVILAYILIFILIATKKKRRRTVKRRKVRR